jgi:phosphoribosylformylglycinamidine cyclo-ligase
MDYKESGVDITKADAFVQKISAIVPPDARVLSGVGGFAAVYKLTDQRYLAACTDGVGTKLAWAQALGQHHGVGIDLVAMCVNDLLCVGATPLFFLDYMAFGQLDTDVSVELIRGIADGCQQSGMALIGGETAEMPGMYTDDEYDLAGFSVGDLTPDALLDGRGAEDGDVLIGIASTGFHSNGFSLLRKLVQPDETKLIHQLLTPTRIYVKLFNALRAQFPSAILGAAHVTGSGIENIPRISDTLDFELTHWPSLNELPPFMGEVLRRIQPLDESVFHTFNVGVGLVLLVKRAAASGVLDALRARSEPAWEIGRVISGSGRLAGTSAALPAALAAR